MDTEQLRNDFLEEISAPIELFHAETRQRLADTHSAESYDKMGLLKQVLTECKRVIEFYQSKGLNEEYMGKIVSFIKPVFEVKRETELVNIDKVLTGIIQKLNLEKGIKPENAQVDEDDLEAFRGDLFRAFLKCPSSKYETLKKVEAGRIDPQQQFAYKGEVLKRMKQHYDKNGGVALNDYFTSNLEGMFNDLWDDQFKQQAIQDLAKERDANTQSFSGVSESIRNAMLKKLM